MTKFGLLKPKKLSKFSEKYITTWSKLFKNLPIFLEILINDDKIEGG